MEFIKHAFYRIFTARSSGLISEERDERNFNADEHLGWSFYKPKHSIQLIPTLSVKNQSSTNTCSWQAKTVQKEVDEKVILSARSIVIQGVREGLIRKNGYANLSAGQKVVKNTGIMKANDCPDVGYNGAWGSFINYPINKELMAKHKDKTYYEVNSEASRYKAIDSGRIFTTGIPWFTGYNSRYLPKNGLLTKRSGYQVGGHAFVGIGYIKAFKGIVDNRIVQGTNGTDVMVFQNSYGKDWGMSFEHGGHQYKGIFFMEVKFFNKECVYGNYVGLDLERSTADFLKTYSGKNVRAYTGGGIYRVSAGKSRVYPSMFDFVSWNEDRGSYIQLNEDETEMLNELPVGDPMKAENAPLYKKHKDKLKELTNPKNLEELLMILYSKS